jgi:hypothetical protein
MGAGQPLADHVVVIAGYQHRQRRPAHFRAGVRRLVPGRPVGRAGLSAFDHHAHRQRRQAGRCTGAPLAHARRHRRVHRCVHRVRRGSRALDADRCPCGAGPWRGHHDGPDDGLRRRCRSEGAHRQRHGPAGDDVGDRHGTWSDARWSADRRFRLARDLPRQRAAGPARDRAGIPLSAGRPGAVRRTASALRLSRIAPACADPGGLCAGDDGWPRRTRPVERAAALHRCRVPCCSLASSPGCPCHWCNWPCFAIPSSVRDSR